MKLKATILAAFACLVLASPASALPAFSVSATVRPDTSVSFVANFSGTSAHYGRSYSWWYGGVKLAGGTSYHSWVAPAGTFPDDACSEVVGKVHYRVGRTTLVTQEASTTFCIGVVGSP